MGQIIGILLIAAVAIYAIKLAFLFLILAGLIFRTRQTLGLLVLAGAWALFWKAPVVSCALIALVAVIAIYRRVTAAPPDEPETATRLSDETGP